MHLCVIDLAFVQSIKNLFPICLLINKCNLRSRFLFHLLLRIRLFFFLLRFPSILNHLFSNLLCHFHFRIKVHLFPLKQSGMISSLELPIFHGWIRYLNTAFTLDDNVEMVTLVAISYSVLWLGNLCKLETARQLLQVDHINLALSFDEELRFCKRVRKQLDFFLCSFACRPLKYSLQYFCTYDSAGTILTSCYIE